MYLIDTNIHVAYLLQHYEDDPMTMQYLEQYTAITLADRAIPDFILGELETYIMQVVPSRYRLNPDDKKKLQELALDYIAHLIQQCTVIAPDVDTIQQAHDLYAKQARTHAISFTDALVLATAKRYQYPILTQDTRLATIAKQHQIPLHHFSSI